MVMYIYTYTYLVIYIYTNLAVDVIVRLSHPRSGDSRGQETFLAPTADKQTRNYDIEYSNHHPSLSTLRPCVVWFLFGKFVTYLGYRHNNNCFSDLYRNITLSHHTDLANLVSTYRPPGNIFWYRLKAKLILH